MINLTVKYTIDQIKIWKIPKIRGEIPTKRTCRKYIYDIFLRIKLPLKSERQSRDIIISPDENIKEK